MDTHGWGSRILVGAALAALTMLGACNGDETAERNQLPVFVSGPVRTTAYDGASDDLLTAGLGKTASRPPPRPRSRTRRGRPPPSCAASRSGRITARSST
jgi:hypothetical protein